jgi:hypothetical protein
VGAKDDAHSTGADPFENAVVREGAADHGGPARDAGDFPWLGQPSTAANFLTPGL